MSDRDSMNMTPDQINVDVLLNSQDYLANTQSDLMTTEDFQQTGEHMGRTVTRSFDQSEEIKVAATTGQSYDYTDHSYDMRYSMEREEGTRHQLRYFETPGSTSDMSLPEGMTQTLEREDSEKVLSHTVDSESDLKMSGKYQDSLEGTGNGHGAGTAQATQN